MTATAFEELFSRVRGAAEAKLAAASGCHDFDHTLRVYANAKMLAARGLIVYRSHLPVKLTGEGAAKAAVIRRRHTTLKRFFKEMLKLDEPQADASACKIEHVIGETALERLAVFTESISERPDNIF